MSSFKFDAVQGMLCVTLLVPTLLQAQSGTPVVTGRTAVSDTAQKPVAKPSVVAAPKPVAKVEYKNLRFDEVYARNAASSHWDDRIKAIPIAPHVALTIGGQVRARQEFARSFNLAPVSDDYTLSRTLLNAELLAGDQRRLHGRLFGEFRDAQAFSRDLPGGTRPQDGDRSDVQNLFGELAFDKSYLRVGRQEAVTGRERLIGVPDWSNTRRAFQGVRAMLVSRQVSFDALGARPVVVRQTAPNIADSVTRFIALTLGNAPGAKALARGLPATWQTYWTEQRITTATPTRRITSGGRVAWTVAGASKTSQSFGLESEGAVQRGSVGARAIHAWFWTVEGSTQWRRVRGKPSIALGLEEASGDRNAADSRVESFNALYAAAHAHGGYADVFGRANARELHVISSWEPIKPVSLRASWHRYDRLRLDDGIYNKQNTLLRAASASTERHAGDEVDLTGTYSLTRHLKVIFGHAWVEPGAFLRETPGGATAERWGFLGTTFTF